MTYDQLNTYLPIQEAQTAFLVMTGFVFILYAFKTIQTMIDGEGGTRRPLLILDEAADYFNGIARPQRHTLASEEYPDLAEWQETLAQADKRGLTRLANDAAEASDACHRAGMDKETREWAFKALLAIHTKETRYP